MRNALASFNMILKAKKRRTRWIKDKTIEKKDLEEDSKIQKFPIIKHETDETVPFQYR